MDFPGNEFLAFGAPTDPEKGPPPGWTQFVPFAVILFIFYLILIRPSQKKAKEHAALIAKLKVGDRVTTSGGIIGVVVSLKDKSVAIRSADTKLDVLRSAVSEVDASNEKRQDSGAVAAAQKPAARK